PTQVVRTALRAAGLIGDGLYGVDLKQVGKSLYVIEVNDNPNIDSGTEDAVLKDELYLRVMRVLLRRLERRKERLW
ncbi:MAG: RimK family alpha-L-glutamate ligase, partial [Desulfuromonadales bacterium]